MWVISLLLAKVQLKVKFSSRVQFFVCLFLFVRNLNTEIFEHSSSSNIYGMYTTLALGNYYPMPGTSCHLCHRQGVGDAIVLLSTFCF